MNKIVTKLLLFALLLSEKSAIATNDDSGGEKHTESIKAEGSLVTYSNPKANRLIKPVVYENQFQYLPFSDGRPEDPLAALSNQDLADVLIEDEVSDLEPLVTERSSTSSSKKFSEQRRRERQSLTTSFPRLNGHAPPFGRNEEPMGVFNPMDFVITPPHSVKESSTPHPPFFVPEDDFVIPTTHLVLNPPTPEPLIHHHGTYSPSRVASPSPKPPGPRLPFENESPPPSPIPRVQQPALRFNEGPPLAFPTVRPPVPVVATTEATLPSTSYPSVVPSHSTGPPLAFPTVRPPVPVTAQPHSTVGPVRLTSPTKIPASSFIGSSSPPPSSLAILHPFTQRPLVKLNPATANPYPIEQLSESPLPNPFAEDSFTGSGRPTVAPFPASRPHSTLSPDPGYREPKDHPNYYGHHGLPESSLIGGHHGHPTEHPVRHSTSLPPIGHSTTYQSFVIGHPEHHPEHHLEHHSENHPGYHSEHQPGHHSEHYPGLALRDGPQHHSNLHPGQPLHPTAYPDHPVRHLFHQDQNKILDNSTPEPNRQLPSQPQHHQRPFSNHENHPFIENSSPRPFQNHIHHGQPLHLTFHHGEQPLFHPEDQPIQFIDGSSPEPPRHLLPLLPNQNPALLKTNPNSFHSTTIAPPHHPRKNVVDHSGHPSFSPTVIPSVVSSAHFTTQSYQSFVLGQSTPIPHISKPVIPSHPTTTIPHHSTSLPPRHLINHPRPLVHHSTPPPNLLFQEYEYPDYSEGSNYLPPEPNRPVYHPSLFQPHQEESPGVPPEEIPTSDEPVPGPVQPTGDPIGLVPAMPPTGSSILNRPPVTLHPEHAILAPQDFRNPALVPTRTPTIHPAVPSNLLLLSTAVPDQFSTPDNDNGPIDAVPAHPPRGFFDEVLFVQKQPTTLDDPLLVDEGAAPVVSELPRSTKEATFHKGALRPESSASKKQNHQEQHKKKVSKSTVNKSFFKETHSEGQGNSQGVEYGYTIGVHHGNGYSYQTRTGFDLVNKSSSN